MLSNFQNYSFTSKHLMNNTVRLLALFEYRIMAETDDLENENLEVTDDEWKEYKKKYKKQYDTPLEDADRRKLYEKTKKMIAEHNRKFKAGEVPFTMKINQFADRKPEESRGGIGGLGSGGGIGGIGGVSGVGKIGGISGLKSFK